jgi:hypothetical protein
MFVPSNAPKLIEPIREPEGSAVGLSAVPPEAAMFMTLPVDGLLKVICPILVEAPSGATRVNSGAPPPKVGIFDDVFVSRVSNPDENVKFGEPVTVVAAV